MDSHTTRTKNIDALNYAKRYGVVMISIPAHTSHKLQPLDVAFFKPLSSYYIDEMEKWLRHNPGRCVIQFQVSMLFGKAYARSASISPAINGFMKTGIYPLDKNVFSEHEFMSIDDDSTPCQDTDVAPSAITIVNSDVSAIKDIVSINSNDKSALVQPTNNKSTPAKTSPTQPKTNEPTPSTSFPFHIAQILPGPKIQ